jgi:hypothetical protein
MQNKQEEIFLLAQRIIKLSSEQQPKEKKSFKQIIKQNLIANGGRIKRNQILY